jgi:hypothetical protein
MTTHDHSFRKLLPGFVIPAGTQVALIIRVGIPDCKIGEADREFLRSRVQRISGRTGTSGSFGNCAGGMPNAH